MLELTINLAAAVLLVTLTTAVHAIGLYRLYYVYEQIMLRFPGRARHRRELAVIIAVVLGLFALHTAEIWLYAIFYRLVGALITFEEALYFSTSTFTTVGFGDIVLDPSWRLLSAIESANGFLLIGWSTAFLVSITGRLTRDEERLIKHKQRK